MQNSRDWRLLSDTLLLIVAELAFDLLFSLLQLHLQIVSIEGINLPRLKPEPSRQQALRLHQCFCRSCPAQ
ncbi:hypothetical protein WP91_003009 [Salmonella enterica subsp. enterica serovar Cerro]|nr:hypothetical protein [Salmonella enterica subsp. enterica serovar Cerro]EAQ6996981.1 hypothetical protein [Salmonella enterica]EAW1651818.1 hypothetical protein [Salmonella enterica subsp. enterica]EAR0589123.1 hypothetical protein [Salmonella enterica subsp. enterica serovar Cerro]EAS3070267.1 hypothetical protein [Salmonella enterica]